MSAFTDEARIVLLRMSHEEVVDYAVKLASFVEQVIDLVDAYEGDELFSEFYYEIQALAEDGPR